MRGLISAVAVAIAVVVQLAVADRIVLLGGSGPDFVLLTVAAVALATGPMTGMLAGFCAGLALDVAPPAGHLVGQDALVFCLVGYLCGLVSDAPAGDSPPEQEHSALFEIGVTAAGAAVGEAMIAALGVMLSDPRVTWAAVKHVLPVAVAYDVLLSPFVLLAVAALMSVTALRTAPAGLGAVGPSPRRAAWIGAAVPAAGAVRQVAGGGSPRLRLSSQGKSEGWLSGAGTRPGTSRPGMNRPGGGRPGLGGGREPKLRLGRGGTPAGGSSTRPGGARRGGGLSGGGLSGGGLSGRGLNGGAAKVRFASRRGEGVVGGSLLGGSAAKLAGSRLGATLLGGSVFRRSPSPFGRSPSLFGRGGGLGGGLTGSGLSGLSGGLGGGRRGLGGGSGISGGGTGSGLHAPRFRRANAVTRLGRGLQRPGQRKSPGRGWLRGSAPGRGAVRALAGNGGRPRNRTGLGHPSRKLTSGLRKGLGGRSPGRGWLRRSNGLGKGISGGKGLGGSRTRLGSSRSGPVRLRMSRPKKPKNWRRTGGFR